MHAPIAIYCSSRAAGGLELNVVRMAVWLQAAGYPVQMIASAGSEIARRSREQEIPVALVERRHSGAALLELRRFLRAKKIHALFVHTSKDLRCAVLARAFSFSDTKLVFVQHMQLGVRKKDLIHSWFFRRLAAWIAPLPYMVRQVAQMTRFDKNRIYEIPFGAELAPLSENKPCQTSARLRLGLPTEGVFAGVIGRFDPQKNQALLLRAAAPLIQLGLPLQLLLVGANTLDNQDDYEMELHALAHELGIAHAVHFRPFQKDVRDAYAALDIFVLTSQAETYGMVTVEALAAGLPVVATRSGGTPELVRDKHDGLLFEPDSAEDLQNALRLLLDFPELRRRFGAAGALDAAERFSHREYVHKLGELISSLV
ncbi:MAG: glycosyltransferase family 4 protein [Spirochaetota bacterium]